MTATIHTGQIFHKKPLDRLTSINREITRKKHEIAALEREKLEILCRERNVRVGDDVLFAASRERGRITTLVAGDTELYAYAQHVNPAGKTIGEEFWLGSMFEKVRS